MVKTTHLGEDYSTIEVNGEEYQASLGLGIAILTEKCNCKHEDVQEILDCKACSQLIDTL